MQPGETADLAGYTVRFDGVQPRCKGPNYTAQRGDLRRQPRRPTGRPCCLRRGASSRSSGMPTTEAGIDTSLWRDLYFVLGDPADGRRLRRCGSTTTRWCCGSGAAPGSWRWAA